MMDKGFLENEKLSYKAKGILGYLLSKPDNWTVNVRNLVNNSTDGKAAVYSGLKELKELGYYDKYPVKNEKGKIKHWENVLYENPMLKPSHPLTDFQEIENQDIDFQDIENRERSNNYLSNNDFKNNYVSESAPAPTETQYGEFKQVRLTVEQFNELIRQYGREKTVDYINRIDRHIASTGKRYRDHCATIKKWISEDESKAKQPESTKQSRFCNFEQRDIDFAELERKEMEFLRQQKK